MSVAKLLFLSKNKEYIHINLSKRVLFFQIQSMYLEVADYQLFMVNTVEKWIGFICRFKESRGLMILTCFYEQV